MTRNWLSARAAAPPPRAARTVLRLEALEERAVPATFTVNTVLDAVDPADGRLSLREAVSRANARPGTDTVVLPAGVFRIALDGANENSNATGDFDVGDSLIVRGAGASLTAIDAQRKDRLFDLHGTIGVRFSGVTLRRGNTNDNGGAVQSFTASISLVGCVVCDNRGGSFGGAIAGGNGKLVVNASTVCRNVASGTGGGLHNVGEASVTDSSIRRNSAASGGGMTVRVATVSNSAVTGNSATGPGGGINCQLTLTVRGSAVSGNVAQDGGGINADTVTMAGTTVSGNVAHNNGGGLFSDTTATVVRSTVSGNFADNGGGIVAVAAMVSNATVSGNYARSFGGGVVLFGQSTITNATVVENCAAVAGGGVTRAPAATGAVEVRNTIIARNLVGFSGLDPDVRGMFITLGHNLIGDRGGSGGFANVNGDVVGTFLAPVDPKLGPLANNGGPTKTHAPLSGSRAIDRGDNAAQPATDQRGAGFPRVKDGNGDGSAVVDIGAFER